MAADSYNIGLLNIELPPGMQDRAERIARNTAAALANIKPGHSINLERVDVPPIRICHGETDSALARRIAETISSSVPKLHQTGGTPE